jgi:UDP-2-acetamido-2-deoxy-ribo-hexuluronate aminotransferase
VYGQYTVRSAQRDLIGEHLKRAGIPTAVHYPLSLHQQPAYADGYRGMSYPRSERLASEVISLPMSADLDDASQKRVVAAVERALQAPAVRA